MSGDFNEIELRRLDLNLLLVFSAVMREGSISRAAGRLYLGPSAVSMALARLRETLGDDLFVRGRSGMEPTPQASALWSEVEPALARIEAALREARHFDPATARTGVRFAAPDDLEFVLIPRLMRRLEREAPGMRLAVRPADFRTLLDRLDSGDADLALSATPTRGLERRHRVRPLYREGFAVLADPAQVATPLTLEAYAAVPHLLVSIAGDFAGPVDALLAGAGRTRTVLAAVSHFPTLPFLLQGRRAVANVPETAARHFARTYDLALSPLPLPSPDFEVALAWHARTDGDPAHAWFRDLVADVVVELRAAAAGPPGRAEALSTEARRGGRRRATARASDGGDRPPPAEH